jgi:hypothetical protein
MAVALVDIRRQFTYEPVTVGIQYVWRFRRHPGYVGNVDVLGDVGGPSWAFAEVTRR